MEKRFGMQLSKSNREGEVAPSFTLKDENGRGVRLEDFTGNWLLLVFHRHLA
jgi:peroxiredoxin